MQGAAAATYPGTISGLRWSLAASATVAGAFSWVIYVLKGGQAAGTVTAAGTPGAFIASFAEEQIMVAGSFALGANSFTPFVIEGSTKVQRKIQRGDTLQISYYGSGSSTGSLVGNVQYFLKS